jgi:hypothetical protein
VVLYLPSKPEALGLILSTIKKKKKTARNFEKEGRAGPTWRVGTSGKREEMKKVVGG